jgi:hypothetical protein
MFCRAFFLFPIKAGGSRRCQHERLMNFYPPQGSSAVRPMIHSIFIKMKALHLPLMVPARRLC